MGEHATATVERLGDFDADGATLIEGLPGHGLVASIAVEQITEQLGLEHHANIVSEAFPPVVTFENGRVRDIVRVNTGRDPDVMTLQSDLVLPPVAYQALADAVIEDLANQFERAIFLVGTPAESEARIGDVSGIATTDAVQAELEDAGISLAIDRGLVGGITGALANACYHGNVPAAVLIVRANPYLPDPAAAEALIEEALEPLMAFDIDTEILRDRADQIQQQLQQIAEQYERMVQDQPSQGPLPSMYQ